MFSFDEQVKKYDQAVERVIQAYDFWYQSVISTLKLLQK